jgi:hypothetical protein
MKVNRSLSERVLRGGGWRRVYSLVPGCFMLGIYVKQSSRLQEYQESTS